MVEIIIGDLFDSETDIIGHQVNMQGKMGAGLALEIKRRYPIAFNRYLQAIPKVSLGDVQFVKVTNQRIVANIFAQEFYGKGLQTDYNAFRRAMSTLSNYCKTHNKTIALPYEIGCCRGGGDWNTIYKIICEYFDDHGLILYKLNP